MSASRWRSVVAFPPMCVMIIMQPAAAGDNTGSLLQHLPSEYVSVPWNTFQSEHSFRAFTKELKPADEGDPPTASRPAVVKVLARARLPVRALLDTFLSEDAQVVSEWNPFAGEVFHIDKAIQLQTYRLPWPFASREYLVRCEDVRRGKAALEAHCRSIDDHPSAPLRPDRVRGRSETVWRFVEEKDGQTSIHLETLVDPKGGLPTWVVDKAGKSAAVKIVRALIKYTTDRYRAHTGGSKGSSTKGRTAQPEMPIASGASSGDSETGTSFFSAMLSRWNIFA